MKVMRKVNLFQVFSTTYEGFYAEVSEYEMQFVIGKLSRIGNGREFNRDLTDSRMSYFAKALNPSIC